MANKFSDFRAQMSPESLVRAEDKAQAWFAEMLLKSVACRKTCWLEAARSAAGNRQYRKARRYVYFHSAEPH